MNNKEKLDKAIEFLAALAKGKTLQCNYEDEGEPKWVDQLWDTQDCMTKINLGHIVDNVERYRIKPEPREYWLVVGNGLEPVAAFTSEFTANKHKEFLSKRYKDIYQLIKVIEVL